MVMYLGRLAEVGPTPELFTAPGHPYTNALLSASPVVDPAERAQRPQRIVLRGDPPSPTDPPSGCRFRTRCQFATDECAVDQPRFEPVAGSTPDHLAACLHLDQQRQATELASGGLRA
jgi:oligopeptide/dipeptide ABC transporter ATP-binding protein